MELQVVVRARQVGPREVVTEPRTFTFRTISAKQLALCTVKNFFLSGWLPLQRT